MMKDLFYCDTVYQVFTVLNIVLNSKYKKVKPDIVIYHQFKKSETLVEALRKSNLFDVVYDMYPVSEGKNKKLKDISRLVLSRNYLKKTVGFSFEQYEVFYCACLDTNASLALYVSADFRKADLFDDGTGSYHGDIIRDYIGENRNRIIKLFHLKKGAFEFEKMLVYCPEICFSTAAKKKEKLIVQKSDEMNRIFGYIENTLYSDSKMIFLDQPYKEIEKRKKSDQEFRKILSQFSKSRIIERLHPRMDEGNISWGEKDVFNNLWELECVNQISDNHILMSIYSTAMLQPYIVADKRPTLIFLYKLYSELYAGTELNAIDNHISDFKKSFENLKIFIPESYDELVIILRQLLE